MLRVLLIIGLMLSSVVAAGEGPNVKAIQDTVKSVLPDRDATSVTDTAVQP